MTFIVLRRTRASRNLPFFLVLFVLLLSSAWAGSGETNLPSLQLKLAYPELILNRPIWLCEAPDASHRIFLIEQPGKVLILPADRNGKETNVFLDISARKPYGGNEEGLLGFAFHPEYKTNGRFYIYYTEHNPRRSVLSEFHVSASRPDAGDPASERILMEIPQPYENHNGGALLFGPDGFLYLSLGDGGLRADPHGFGQNTFALLGKILRIDVNSRSGALPYGIPKDNPFAGKPGFREEIWALGLRNAWRVSFDRETGELWAGDVGQDKWEEVDLITKGGNYGWNIREGFHPFTNAVQSSATLLDPIIEYPHNPAWDTNHAPGLSITGGYVYRGQKIPALRGTYLYADFSFGTIWGLRYEKGRVTWRGALVKHPRGVLPIRNVASFGEDAAGEIYILAFEGAVNGRIYELAETP